MTEQQWRVLDGSGNDMGPYSVQDIQNFFASGNVTHETLVWTEGMPEWLPAGQIPGLLPQAQVPVVPLAEAAPAPAASAPGAGINLSPQISVAGAAKAQTPGGKSEKPSGFSIFTVGCGILVIILFFFPWISINRDVDGSDQVKLVTFYTQTGMQTITRAYSVSDDPIPDVEEDQGMKDNPEEAEEPETEEEPEEKPADSGEDNPDETTAPGEADTPNETSAGESPEEKPKPSEAKKDQEKKEEDTRKEVTFDRSIMVLIAFIAVSLGTILALIGIFKPVQMLTISGQLLFVFAAFLIGIQMALQFPIAKVILDSQGEVREAVQKVNKPLFEAYDAIGNGDLETAKAIAAKCKPKTKRMIQDALIASPAEITKLANELRKSEAQLEVPYGVSYGATCFIAVGLLAIFIFVAVITMSSASATPIVTNPGGFQMPVTGGQGQQQPGQPSQPQQPGSGLKFH